MRAVVQRVTCAKVEVEGRLVAGIKKGLLVLVAVMEGDEESDLAYVAQKIAGLRIFEDEAGKMNRSVLNEQGEVLLVSQFTLAGDVRHGKRPSFSASAAPGTAESMYQDLAKALNDAGIPTCTGEFGADMQVSLTNDGPVTILLDSRRLF